MEYFLDLLTLFIGVFFGVNEVIAARGVIWKLLATLFFGSICAGSCVLVINTLLKGNI